MTLRPFPTLPLARVPDTLSSSLGPCFYFIVTALPVVLMALNALVGEKEKQLRRCMILMGLRRESWFVSWYLTFALISAFVGLILAALGRAFHFDFFVNSNFGVVFFTFWLHSMAELSLSFFVMVWMRRTSSAVLFATFWYIPSVSHTTDLGIFWPCCSCPSSFPMGFWDSSGGPRIFPRQEFG
jgi:ABC-2 family transporter protein